MKKLSILLAIISCFFSLATVAQNYYEVENFTGVTTSETVKAEITIADNFSVELKGEEEAIDELVVELRKNMLVIRPKLNWKSWQRTFPNANVVAHISMPIIKTLIVSGAGGIKVNGKNKTDALTLTISGSANVSLANESKQTTLILSGSGSCDLKGNSNYVTTTVSGSGKLNAFEYKVQNFNCILSGGAKIYTHTENSLKATISGSGMVYYKGYPDVKATTLMGSGKVQSMDDSN